MKMKIGVLATLCATSMHGMEMEKNWTILLHGTQINLTQGNMLALYADGKKKVDLIVVGYHEQEIIGKGTICGCAVGGCRQIKTVRFRMNCGVICEQRKGCNRCFKITEPFVKFEDDPGKITACHYEQFTLLNNNNNVIFHEQMYKNEKAIEQASADLALCYNNAFMYGLKQLKEKNEKSIAFPTLSADVGFPRDKAAYIAVASILECIQYHPKAYSCIELFMQEKEEFDLYKELLTKYQRIIDNFFLFYCAHKYNAFSVPILQDVVHSIVRLCCLINIVK